MPANCEDVAAVRREIMDLLRLQMQALDSPLGLTDAQVKECYERQGRVQELREILQASLSPCASNPVPASTAADVSASA